MICSIRNLTMPAAMLAATMLGAGQASAGAPVCSSPIGIYGGYGAYGSGYGIAAGGCYRAVRPSCPPRDWCGARPTLPCHCGACSQCLRTQPACPTVCPTGRRLPLMGGYGRGLYDQPLYENYGTPVYNRPPGSDPYWFRGAELGLEGRLADSAAELDLDLYESRYGSDRPYLDSPFYP